MISCSTVLPVQLTVAVSVHLVEYYIKSIKSNCIARKLKT